MEAALSIASTGRSDWERDQSLLVPRLEGCRLLAISPSTAFRLERAGVLIPVKLLPNTPNAKTYYRRANIMRLAQQRGDDR
jgi:hypothetical protein